MILPYEEYNRLFQKRQNMSEADIDAFTNQEYSDLMALFNLAWFDPSYKNEYLDLKKLFKKGKDFTLEDRQKIIEIQRDIIRRIIPAYRNYVENGKLKLPQVHIITRYSRFYWILKV